MEIIWNSQSDKETNLILIEFTCHWSIIASNAFYDVAVFHHQGSYEWLKI